jgi:hypothetical protein
MVNFQKKSVNVGKQITFGSGFSATFFDSKIASILASWGSILASTLECGTCFISGVDGR